MKLRDVHIGDLVECEFQGRLYIAEVMEINPSNPYSSVSARVLNQGCILTMHPKNMTPVMLYSLTKEVPDDANL